MNWMRNTASPLEHPEEGVPEEHWRLIALLNRFGFHLMSKQEAMKLAGELLDVGWEQASLPDKTA